MKIEPSNNYPKFEIAGEVKPEHQKFFKENGFLHFKDFLPHRIVHGCLSEIQSVQEKLHSQDVHSIFGIPIYWGEDSNGQVIAHRHPISS